MAAISQNISEILKSVNLKKPAVSTLAQKGSDELVQHFLSENVDLGSEEKETAQSQLYIASFWGFADVVKTLVKNGADVNYQNSKTLWTPLHAAAFQEHGKVIMFLLECNANSLSEDYEGRTSVDFGSASDKIWTLFAARGCTRTPRKALIDKNILRKAANNDTSMNDLSVEKDSRAMRNTSLLINYNSSNAVHDTNNKRNAQAASVDGDVLAGDITSLKETSHDEQPNFNAWRN